MRCSHGGQQRKNFWSLVLHIAGKFISNTLSDWRSIACTSFVYSGSDFFWNLGLSWGVRLSFLTQFKIEFLLPFTGCRKMLEKIPVPRLLPWQIHLLKYFIFSHCFALKVFPCRGSFLDLNLYFTLVITFQKMFLREISIFFCV